MSALGDLGRRIADDIEARGHYQGPGCGASAGSVCVVTAPSLTDNYGWDEEVALLTQMAGAIGLNLNATASDLYSVIPEWNDRTDSEVVLKTLRNLDIESER